MNDAEIRLKVIVNSDEVTGKINDIKLAAGNLNDKLDETEKTGEKTTKKLSVNFENLSKSFTNAGKKLTAGLTLPIVGLIGVGVKYNATVEDLTTSFKVMTGSAEKAGDIVERLKDIGSKTPFEFTDLAETTKLLMNYGLTADDAISKMEMLGDISQGNADKMNRISMAYGQMSSAGKVSLEDVKQMIEAGFNPLKEISESTGESMSSLYDRISKGSISVDEITASMQRSTSEGGKYFGSMEEQSQTTTGKLSTLKDEFLSATGSLTESLIPAFQSGVEWLTKLSNWFSSLSEDQRKMILTVMGVLAVLGPMLLIVGKIIGVINLLTKATWLWSGALWASPVTWIIAGIVALIAIIVLLVKNFDKISAVASNLWSTWKNGFQVLANFLNGVFRSIGNSFIGLLNLMIRGLNAYIKLMLLPVNTLIKGWNATIGKVTGKISTINIAIPNIPKLDVGTNNVKSEGLAYLHQGEAVVPKKYNPAIGGGNANMSNPVYVNVEVQQDKFGNYTNTIKTFSNGSKNSYNYGAS